jgi:SAM-dependent methyltransferase
VIFGGLVLFMLPDPSAALANYRKLLVPGGRLCFSTFGTQDANFEAGMKAFGGFVPGGTPPRGDRQGPFASRDGIADLLATNGFETPQFAEFSFESRFADADHWVSWVWSHGGRYTVERIPAEQLDEATAAAKEAFEPARTPTGDYLITTEIRFTVAHR